MKIKSILGQLVILLTTFCHVAIADPKPGDIFKEYVYKKKTDFFNGPFSHLDSVSTTLAIEDLDKATRVEIAFYYWGGHTGTSGQAFRANNGSQYKITQPVVNRGFPECYYRTVAGRSAIEFPLTDIQEGDNTFTFFCGEQICYNFNWPHYWIYKYVVRVYYSEDKAAQKGQMVSPLSGSTIGDFPDLEFSAIDPDSVARVDFIAYYNGFDTDGDGILTDWQYQVKDTEWTETAGYSLKPRFKTVWNNYWVPDQDEPIRIMAKVTDKNGYVYMSEAVEGITLARSDRSVRMYLSDELPEVFGVRKEQRRECQIVIPDFESTDGTITDARMYVSTWSADIDNASPFHEIGINRQVIANKFGKFHDHSLDMLDLPITSLRQDNTIHIYSTFWGHALEVNWPGPALLVERRKDVAQQEDHISIKVSDHEGVVVNLENQLFKATVRSHPGAKCGTEHAIRDWIWKGTNQNQAAFVIDACAQRGPLGAANVLFQHPDSAAVELTYRTCDNKAIQAVSKYTIYQNSPFIKIDYLSYPDGWWNTVDIGQPGGESQGVYHIHGMEAYPRDLALYPDSYWNTYDPGYESDPKNGGVLNYKGYVIMMVADRVDGTGFGRIMPIKTDTNGGMRILKLLHRRGFETFPGTGDANKPFTAALFAFEGGIPKAVDTAKKYIDNLVR